MEEVNRGPGNCLWQHRNRIVHALAPRKLALIWGAAMVMSCLWNAAMLHNIEAVHGHATMLGWDANCYFLWGRSIALDGDVDFENDFRFMASLEGFGATRDDFAAFLQTTPRTATGLIPNKYGEWLGLLAAPALWTAKLLSRPYSLITHRALSDFSGVYTLVFLVTCIVLGFLGLLASWRLVESIYGTAAAFSGQSFAERSDCRWGTICGSSRRWLTGRALP